MGLLSLCDAQGNRLEIGASFGFDQQFLEAVSDVPPRAGACGMCFSERRRIIVEDVETDPIFAPYLAEARRAGFRAVHSTPLIARSGKAIGVLSTYFRKPHRPSERELRLVDLCARQAVEFIENARLYACLREIDQAKNDFLATLAHELRNPLAPIRNALHLLQLKGPADPELVDARDIIDRQLRQMTRLVDDLLDIARISNGKLNLRRERIELAQVVQSALEISRPLIIARGHELTVSVPAEPIPLDGDLTRLAQVVSNLLNNAARYTEPGGRIWLTAERQGSDAVISVRDSGIGIAADILPRVFEMFIQAHRPQQQSEGGLGIGLTLVKRLVEMHGGTVNAGSNGPGTGSEFVVRLPVALLPPLPAHSSNGGKQAAAGASSLRILVVDDNRDSTRSLSRLHQLTGHSVRCGYDGQEAFNLAEEFRPEVALLDIGLPIFSGYEVARRIRENPWGRDMVLIALTGWGQEDDRRRSHEAGFDHHLVKPIDLATLRERLASLKPRTTM
jgi:signal transduction histidine kinase/CheY-like chemotaxis protein